MNTGVDSALVLLILTNLALLGSSRVRTAIRMVAVQGIVLGVLAILAHRHDLTARALILAVGGAGLKAFVFPWLLLRARREADVRHEATPFVGYKASIVLGAVALWVSLRLGARLPLPEGTISSLAVPAALFTILVGLFVIVSRRTALLQVVGYLALENGVYAFGVVAVREAPLLVELGVLLDVFVAVFVMGIAIFHINREFAHIDTDRLAELRDFDR